MALTVMAAALTSQTAEPFRQVLTDSSSGIHTDSWELTSSDFKDVESKLPWSVRKRTLQGGLQEGVDVIVVDNGLLQFTVIPTRGMGIHEARLGDLRLGWESPVKEIVHPKFINLHDRGGLGWLAGFNEWMVRCGLEFAGHPGEDTFINNVGDEAKMDLTLHGKIANIPASIVEVVIDREPPHPIRIRGRVDERSFYGPQLELWTEIATTPGSDTFTINDRLTNHGAFDQEFQMIYHTNFGLPLLGKGAKFDGAFEKVVPFNNRAAEGLQTFDIYDAPTLGFIEQVYCIHPYADKKGSTTILISNAKKDRGVSMTYSTKELPYLTLWKNTASKEEGYVTGLEPATGFPYNRRVERHFGRVPKLAPQATRSFSIHFRILDDKREVKKVVSKINRIQNTRKTVKVAMPPVLPE